MNEAENQSEIVLYTTTDGKIKIDTIFQNETIWLTQKTMAELFGVNIPAISKHLSNIYDEGELKRDATVSKMEIVQQEGTIDKKNAAQASVVIKKTLEAGLIKVSDPEHPRGGYEPIWA